MLLSNLNLLATAPGGVARLRELILTLAVQGKLVPQNPSDEAASVLLEKIRAEKDRLIAAGKIKPGKPLAAIAEGEHPFEIPNGWEWARFGDVALISSGITLGRKTAILSPVVLPYLRVANVQRWHLNLTSIKEVVIDQTELARFQLCNGDLLITEGGDWDKVGRTAIWRDELPTCLHQNHVFKVRGTSSDWNPLWAEMYLNSMIARTYFASSAKQTTNLASINMTQLKNCMFPLPPLAEQSRIVARVEELMRLCDALETKGQLEAAQHAQLVTTLLGTLADSETPDTLAQNWQRIASHFDLLLDRPQAVDALEQSILQLAVRGLLVPQDPGDEPASALLQKIRAEKDQLIAADKIKRDKPLQPVAEAEKPFQLPLGWEWTRFPNLCTVTGGATPSKAIASNWIGEIPWVSPKDMKIPFISDAQDHVSNSAVRGSLSLIPPGSLLMVVRGMILAHSFPIAQTKAPVTINQDMKALTPFEARLLSFLALICEGMKPEILGLIHRSSHGTCKLESGKIFGMAIPLPPLPEQSRIVARVQALRGLCADLRQRLAASRAAQAQLAEALVSQPNG